MSDEPDASLGADHLGPGTGGEEPEDDAREPGSSDQACLADQEPAGGDPARPARKRLGKALGKATARSPRMGAFAQRAQESAQRAQETAREGLATARKNQAVDRAFEAGRTAREATLPRLSHARQRVQKSAGDPEVAAEVARSLAIAVWEAAADRPGARPEMKAQAPAVGDHVGKAVGKLVTWRHRETGQAGAADEAATLELTDGSEDGRDAEPGLGSGAEATDLGALADSLGVRPPPDPAALYQDGPEDFELLFALPEELSSLPWGSLSRRNHFYLLVAAWARREADGIHLLKAGQLDQAGEAFQECLIRAEQVKTPALVVRSYEDLAELAAADDDEAAAGEWRAAAARAAGR